MQPGRHGMPLDALAHQARWVAWRSEPRGRRVTKVPYAPTGRRAKADDPGTWGTRAEAEATAKKIANGQSGGIGIQLGDLGEDTHLCGIDLDSCITEEGALAAWAVEIRSGPAEDATGRPARTRACADVSDGGHPGTVSTAAAALATKYASAQQRDARAGHSARASTRGAHRSAMPKGTAVEIS
jgi:hypothetical protein